jgi:hypothetical protein
MLQNSAFEWMRAGTSEIHDIEFLLTDLVKDTAPDTADLRERQPLGGQKEKIDVTAPTIIVGPGSEEIAVRLWRQVRDMAFDHPACGFSDSHGWNVRAFKSSGQSQNRCLKNLRGDVTSNSQANLFFGDFPHSLNALLQGDFGRPACVIPQS